MARWQCQSPLKVCDANICLFMPTELISSWNVLLLQYSFSRLKPKTIMLEYLLKYFLSFPSLKSHSFMKYCIFSLNPGINSGKVSFRALSAALQWMTCKNAVYDLYPTALFDILFAYVLVVWFIFWVFVILTAMNFLS